MEGAKKVAVIVVLLAVIGGAGAFIIHKVIGRGEPKALPYVLNRKVEKVDQSTLELMTLTLGEWEDLGSKNRVYKNPDTGEYTMVEPFICPSCFGKIPGPRQEDIEDGVYICPRCGNVAETFPED